MLWFKLYSDIISDVKLLKVSSMTNISWLTVLGFWTALLAIANDAPSRGSLELNDGIVLTAKDIATLLRENIKTVDTLYNAFLDIGLIDTDGNICAWNARQVSPSTERVRRHRAKLAGDETPCNVSRSVSRNADETGEERREKKRGEIREKKRKDIDKDAEQSALVADYINLFYADGAPQTKAFATSIKKGFSKLSSHEKYDETLCRHLLHRWAKHRAPTWSENHDGKIPNLPLIATAILEDALDNPNYDYNLALESAIEWLEGLDG